MTPSSARERRLAYLAWVAVCVIWGTTYLGIRISLESMPPALMGGLRWTLAGALLAIYAIVARRQAAARVHLGRHRAARLPAARRSATAASCSRSSGSPSGLAAVLVATSPFWMAARRSVLPDGERLTARTAAGLFIGFLGIVVLVWPELGARRRGCRKVPGRRGRAADRVVRLVARLVVFEARTARRERPGHDRAADAGRRPDDVAAGTVRGEWSSLFFTAPDNRGAGVSVDDRRDRRVRRLHVRAAAPAGVVRFAVRLHQSDDRRRARRSLSERAVHVAHGDRRRAGVRGRGHRAADEGVTGERRHSAPVDGNLGAGSRAALEERRRIA